MSPTAEARSVLNGLFGDLLAERGSPLAIPMTLRGGDLRPAEATRSVCVFVPGLMSGDGIWQFPGRPGTTYGSRLSADRDVTPLFVHYNSGRHVSDNGRELAGLLEHLLDAWPAPVDEVNLVGHSMGGLVVRSACHFAVLDRRRWAGRVARVFLLGAPLSGAPLEKLLHTADFTLSTIWNPVTRLIGRALRRRSAGIKDLRFGSLVEDDWSGRDPDQPCWPRRHAVPLLTGARHYAIASTVLGDSAHPVALLLGDPLVTGYSAQGRCLSNWGTPLLPDTQVHRLPGIGHLALAHHDEVYARMLGWWDVP